MMAFLTYLNRKLKSIVMKVIRLFWNPNPETGVSYSLNANGQTYSGTETYALMNFSAGENVHAELSASGGELLPSSPAILDFTVPVDNGQYQTPSGFGWEVVQPV